MGHPRSSSSRLVPAADADGGFANRAVGRDRGRPRQRGRQHAVAGDEEQPCATVRVTLSRERAVEVPGIRRAGAAIAADPTQFPVRTRRARAWPALVHGCHGGARGRRRRWFRMKQAIIDGAGPLVHAVLGPGGLDPWHRPAVAGRGGRSEPESDGSVIQAAGGRMGRRSRAGPVATGSRVGSAAAPCSSPRRDRPGFDVGDSGAISEARPKPPAG